MTTMSKRSAGDAFEDVEPAHPTSNRKRKRRNRPGKHMGDDHSNVNVQSAESTPGDHQLAKDQESHAADTSNQATLASNTAEAHGGKSKKKRKHDWKIKQAEAAALSSPTSANGPPTVLESEPSRKALALSKTPVSPPKNKRRRGKKNKSQEPNGTVSVVEGSAKGTQPKGGKQALGTASEHEEDPQSVATMASHPVETVQEAKERELLKLKSKLQTDDDAGNEPLPEEPSVAPDTAEGAVNNNSPRKRKRRSRVSISEPHPTNIAKGAADSDSVCTEVKTKSLESRVSAPDDFERRQQMIRTNGNVLSASNKKHQPNLEAGNSQAMVVSSHDRARSKKHSHHADQRLGKHQSKSWIITEAIGGIFIDQDPILTADDEHLIVATRAQVRVYSRATSLLVRKLELEPDEDGSIVSYSLVKEDDSLLIVATSRGLVSIWNWIEGTALDVCMTGNGLKKIVPFYHDGLLSIVAVHTAKDKDTVKLFNLATGNQNAEELAKVHECIDIEHIRFFESVGAILISARSRMEIGLCRNFQLSNLDGDSFKWYRLGMPANVASFDARVGSHIGKRALPQVDLTVGLSTGDILNYTDVLSKLISREKGRLAEIEPQTLSWHRKSVNAVKWSHDLTHIISGGRETTLVIWQLDTNRQQYLPHLSAPILNLSVSEKGSAYALRLADNSVMVLDTANLTPETNISGIAAPVFGPLIAALDPNHPEKVLLACPTAALQPLRQESQNTFLQTYDIHTDTQIGRQALTRNLTTVVNIDPEGRPRREPNVSRLQVSACGRWLATIDEWRPPLHDMDATHLAAETRARKHDCEIRLRIWAYNSNEGDWELVTRVDEPNSVARILNVQSNPTRPEFAAVGADGIIRVWYPRARVRDGVRVRDSEGKQLYTWTNMYAMNIPLHGYEEAKSAALTYSEDGSIIAVSFELGRKGSQWTYLLDSQTGKIVHSIPDLTTDGERCLAISGRFLLLLSRTFCVYDFIAGQVISRTDLSSPFHGQQSSRFLALNRLDNTVALAVSRKGRDSSHLIILDANKLEEGAALEARIPGQIRALLAPVATAGFVLIDDFHEARTVKPPKSPRARVSGHSTAVTEEPEEVSKGLDRLFGTANAVDGVVANGGDSQGTLLLENGPESVANRGLEEILAFSTSEQAPNVDGLFERVAQVVGTQA